MIRVHFVFFFFSILFIFLLTFLLLIPLPIRSLDVLSLIAKVLSFTDDQLETVGLRVPSKNIFTSIISSFTPAEPVAPSDGEVRTDRRIINILYFIFPRIEFVIFLSFSFPYPYIHLHLHVHLPQLFLRTLHRILNPPPPTLNYLCLRYVISFHSIPSFLFCILIFFSAAIS